MMWSGGGFLDGGPYSRLLSTGKRLLESAREGLGRGKKIDLGGDRTHDFQLILTRHSRKKLETRHRRLTPCHLATRSFCCVVPVHCGVQAEMQLGGLTREGILPKSKAGSSSSLASFFAFLERLSKFPCPLQ